MTTAYIVKISGTAYPCTQGTLQCSNTIGKRATASFTLHIPNTSTHFSQYQQVAIYDYTNTLVFSGYIGQVVETKPGFQASLDHQVTCIDQHYLADKRVIAESFVNTPLDEIVYTIWNFFLQYEGVTVGQIGTGPYPSTTLYPSNSLYPGAGVIIPSASFAYCTIAQAFDALLKQASADGVQWYWMIDLNKKLWFVPYGAVINSTVVDGTQIDQVNTPPQVTRQNPLYRNQQWVVSNSLQTDPQNETRQGDGITKSWAMGYALDLLTGVNVNGSAQSFGIKGKDSGRAYYWAQGSPTITQDPSVNVLQSTDVLGVAYVGQYQGAASDDNLAAITAQAALDGSSGINDDAIRDDTSMPLATAVAEADQLLGRYCQSGVQLQFTTRTTGFAPGQQIPVNLPEFALASTTMLIEQVDFSDQQDGVNVWFTVKAIQGPFDITYQDFFSRALATPPVVNSINVGV